MFCIYCGKPYCTDCRSSFFRKDRNMKHKWKSFWMANEPILPARCSECGEIAMCEADWCDSAGIVKWEKKIMNRNDCPGKRK